MIALVAGYAIGGGHVLHVICDLTMATYNGACSARPPKVGSFDGGFRPSFTWNPTVGQKRSPCQLVSVPAVQRLRKALEMGLVEYRVVRSTQLEEEGIKWAQEIPGKKPHRHPVLKIGLPLRIPNGQACIQELAGNASHALL